MFVGSFNFDQRSLFLNTDIGLVFDQPAIAGPVSDKFEGKIERIAFRVELITQDDGKESLRWHGTNNGEAIEYDSEPYVGRGTRLAVWFIRWLPVDWLL